MDFESILEKWESSQYSETSEEKKHQSDWLEAYPPDFRVIEEKSRDDISGSAMPPKRKRVDWKRIKIQDSLDIHGLTSWEALEHLHNFVNSMKLNGYKAGLIIHGKGLHSRSEPVLKPLVNKFLKNNPHVDKFAQADNKKGGAGSTLFLIKK